MHTNTIKRLNAFLLDTLSASVCMRCVFVRTTTKHNNNKSSAQQSLMTKHNAQKKHHHQSDLCRCESESPRVPPRVHSGNSFGKETSTWNYALTFGGEEGGGGAFEWEKVRLSPSVVCWASRQTVLARAVPGSSQSYWMLPNRPNHGFHGILRWPREFNIDDGIVEYCKIKTQILESARGDGSRRRSSFRLVCNNDDDWSLKLIAVVQQSFFSFSVVKYSLCCAPRVKSVCVWVSEMHSTLPSSGVRVSEPAERNNKLVFENLVRKHIHKSVSFIGS